MTRGEKNCNPFNLKKSAIPWKGKVPNPTDNTFEQFTSNLYGLRAGFLNLINQGKEGNNTVRKLISKYAPPLDNNPTDAYIMHVCTALGVQPDDVINLTDFNTLKTVGLAIINQEEGEDIYDDVLIRVAIKEAGVINATRDGNGLSPSLFNRMCKFFGF